MFSSRNILDVIELIYFTPVLVLALMVSFRHGFSRQLGWISIVMLSLFRLSGASTGIAATYKPSNGLITASIVLTNFGLVSLILAVQGLSNRLNSNLPENKRIGQRIFKLVHLVTTAATALAIVGAVNITDSDPTNDSSAKTYQRVAIILFVVILLVLTLISSYIFRNKTYSSTPEDHPLITAIIIIIPLIAIRLLYSLLVVFDVNSDVFSTISPKTTAVVVEAFMENLEEFIIAAVVIMAGFKVPVIRGGNVNSHKTQHAPPRYDQNTSHSHVQTQSKPDSWV